MMVNFLFFVFLQCFFKIHDVPCNRAIQQGLEMIALNTRLMDRDGESVCRFLLRFAEDNSCDGV